MKKLLTFLLIASILSACNRTQSTPDVPPDQPVVSYPNEPSYPNAPSYPNDPGTDKPSQSPYGPQPEDSTLTRGTVFIENSEVLIMESYPIQVMLVLEGNLPTPCNQLRVIANPPDKKNRILVDVYSILDPAVLCTQVLEPFEANIGLGSFPAGHYSVWVNGEMAGEFDA